MRTSARFSATVASLIAASCLALTACSNGDSAPVTVTHTESVTVAATSSTTSSSATSASKTPSATAKKSSNEPADVPVIGVTSGFDSQGPRVLNKKIARCGTPDGHYEQGTTFFTDGTTGWTQNCSEQTAHLYQAQRAQLDAQASEEAALQEQRRRQQEEKARIQLEYLTTATLTTEQASAPATPEDIAPDAPVGFTGVPGQQAPAPMAKTIARCGTAAEHHETGTTFFTDGTTGWTQECTNQMMAAAQ